MEVAILSTKVSFELNVPNPDDGWIKEDFDISKKPACATIWVSELIGADVQTVIMVIFAIFQRKASETPLDYLQKLKINDTQCWCIDDGGTVTILLPEEY